MALFLLHSLLFLTHMLGDRHLCAYTCDTSWHKTAKRGIFTQKLSQILAKFCALWSPTSLHQTANYKPDYSSVRLLTNRTLCNLLFHPWISIIATQVAGVAATQLSAIPLNLIPEQDRFKEALCMQPPATASPLLLFLSPQTTALHHKQFQFPCSRLIWPWHFSLPLRNFCQPSPPHPVSLSPDCSLLLPLINVTKLPFNIVSPAALGETSLTLKLSGAIFSIPFWILPLR